MSPWRRLLGEPLVHFFAAGAAVFGAYQWFSDTEVETLPEGNRIEISENDIRQIAAAWLAQGRLPLTLDQLQSLIDRKIAEEVLFREGLALGLDRNDEIIKRRIAQKMDFLAADVAALQEPEKAELEAWFSRNSGRFAIPRRMSFRHLYFSPDKRGAAARAEAEAALQTITDKGGESADVSADPFMLRSYYTDVTPNQILKEFGSAFAAELFELEPGGWRGPVRSGYGWHLVWIDKMKAARIPAFEEIEADVRSAWISDRYKEVKRSALEEMRSRYTVVVPPLDSVDLSNVMSAGPDRTSTLTRPATE